MISAFALLLHNLSSLQKRDSHQGSSNLTQIIVRAAATNKKSCFHTFFSSRLYKIGSKAPRTMLHDCELMCSGYATAPVALRLSIWNLGRTIVYRSRKAQRVHTFSISAASYYAMCGMQNENVFKSAAARRLMAPSKQFNQLWEGNRSSLTVRYVTLSLGGSRSDLVRCIARLYLVCLPSRELGSTHFVQALETCRIDSFVT